MTVFIDRSNVNGSDDYKKAPTTHLYLKVTEGSTFVDATYQQRRQQGEAAGAKVGGYHFAGHNDPTQEAAFFLSKLGKPTVGDLRPCLDLESGQSAGWAVDFVKHIHDELGYYPVLYGSTSFIQPMRSNRVLKRCPWWRAEFGPNDGQRHPLRGGDLGAAAHQYTSRATVPGITGHTDRSAILDEAKLLVAEAKPKRPIAVYRDGQHLRNFRTRTGAAAWQVSHRQPRKGHQIQVRNRG